MDTLDTTACYLALQARDHRFDGVFFTGVTSTGIYCRPVCRVRTPRFDNCRFFSHPAQAEAAGFRPCLRCRPELAPSAGSPAAVWSTEDASSLLATEAARQLRHTAGHSETGVVAQVAQRLGVSERHLRRIFAAHWGTSPMQFLQTQRLLQAKLLLTDTRLPVSTVAALSGFASQRRFHAAWQARYRLNPLQLRRPSSALAAPAAFHASTDPGESAAGFVFRLPYRPPLDVLHLLDFLAQRAMLGVEWVDVEQARWGSTLSVRQNEQQHAGWVMARFDAHKPMVWLQVSQSLAPVLPEVLQRVRHALDLDLMPDRVHEVLQESFPDAAGQRLPGALDGFTQAVRAVLGQQVTVKAARTLAQRLVDCWGTSITTPWPGLTHLFPAPQVLAQASEQDLGEQGITRQRQAAIRALALGVASGGLQLHPGAPFGETLAALKALPGIGDWTAHYIAMRALHWPDAYPAGDVALHHALGLKHLSLREATRQAQERAVRWRPWRAYAVIRAWDTLTQQAEDTP